MPTEKQRRQAAQRKIARQLERRREMARKRRQRNLVAGGAFAAVVAVILILVLATNIFSGSNKKSDASAPSASPSTSVSASGTPASPFPTATFVKADRKPKATTGPCKYAESTTELQSPYSKDVGLPPDPNPTPATGTVAVSLKTSHGALKLTLDRASAPCAVQSFVYLVKKGLYDNSSCPRLTTSGIYVLQCGDPSNSQNGGPTYAYKQEATSKSSYGAGVIAMANTGQAKSTGSQFFIIYKDSNSGLKKSYSVVGRVSSGMDVVTKVAAGKSDNSNADGDGKPVLGLTIDSAKLS
ncbi:MAG TPA: peptidylprolyl isomerase [Mycobacteriales bacterium]|nr:peptidylprolyl isomerase [Mycobacteriales bacterium]